MPTKAAGTGKRTHCHSAETAGGTGGLDKRLPPHALARSYAEVVKLREEVRLAEARRAASTTLPADPSVWDA